MKKTLFLLIIFSIAQGYGQESRIEKLMIEGNQAYQESDFNTAKLSYQAILKIDSNHSDAMFNLAATELNLGNTDQACENLQKSYSLGDFQAYDLILQYCDGLKYSERMFPFHVDELPKFKYKDNFEPLIINQKQINSNYIKLLKTEIKNSKTLRRIRGKIFLMIKVDINGNLITNVKGEISELQKKELINALTEMTIYHPATFQGKNVDLFGGGFSLPLIL